jgi:hypothetical protein
MKQIQLADIVEIKSIMRLNSLRTGNNEEKVSDPFHFIKPHDFNEFGYIRATEATSEVTLSEHDLNYVSSRNVVLKPYDILIAIRFPSTIPVGIILDEISLDCIASPVFSILRVENHQLRKEISLNIFSFFVSQIGSQVLHHIQNLPTGRRESLSQILIPVLEGNERETLVNNIEKEIQKYKEIEKIKTEIYQTREKTDLLCLETTKKS